MEIMSKTTVRLSQKKGAAHSFKRNARAEIPLYGQGYSHLMDIKPHLEQASQEEAREKLISIAYSSPEEIYGSTAAALNSSVTMSMENKDDVDKYRAELISLSYIQSPDMEASPLPNGIYHG